MLHVDSFDFDLSFVPAIEIRPGSLGIHIQYSNGGKACNWDSQVFPNHLSDSKT